MELYDFQKRIAQHIRAGRSVVLQAPTGSGKTFAALWPFLEAWDRKPDNFPRKCVYAVPMRILANQFTASAQELVTEKLALIENPDIRIQTGEQQEDRRFEGNLVFCTIDQFLSSYLTMPYSLPNRLANLNAGAMVGSYLVFDEFHLLDPGSTLPSTLYALRQLRKIAPVLLMTATFSKSMLHSLAKILDAEVELVSPDEARAIETRDGERPRQRAWNTAEEPLSAEAVLAGHKTRSLALCNTVWRAQNLYRELRDLIQTRELDIDLLLLHSRFLPEDRQKTEDSLRRLFGKDAVKGGSLIAIATQTIEVGVDITCETLHTELAPASALIQRAGRCARYPGEQGQVIVYPVESYMP
ncbi:MAG: CRISPR-associated helicase Cas3', partial [Anaerolineales bacterium]